jgi:hypothetical protein
MHKHREPAWWMLYALVPVMGVLLVMESRASFSPGWHKGVQVGIILFVYGLVWMWLWANDHAMLRDSLNCDSLRKHDWGVTDAARHSIFQSQGTLLTPLGHGGSGRLGFTSRCINRRAHIREIHKCSRSLDRQSRRWRS